MTPRWLTPASCLVTRAVPYNIKEKQQLQIDDLIMPCPVLLVCAAIIVQEQSRAERVCVAMMSNYKSEPDVKSKIRTI